jgi:hypothetical protein
VWPLAPTALGANTNLATFLVRPGGGRTQC